MSDPPPGGGPGRPPPRYLAIPGVRPRLTYALLAINLLIFVLQTATGRGPWFALGAKINERILAGEWWRLISPMFLHADLLHIAFNSYALYIFGLRLEAVFGHRRFLIIYLLSGVAGAVLSFAFSPYPSVGASGAIFGLIGALLVYLFRHRQAFGEMGRRRLMEIAIVAGFNLLIGLRPSIDNWGHLGGLLGGAALTWLIGPIFAVTLEPGGNPVVVDRNQLGGQQWLAVFAVMLALGAGTFVIATLQQ